MDEDDLEFYNSIIKITKNSGLSYILNRDSQTIFEVVTKNYKKNIRIAADHGLYKAYLCIYEVNAKYKGVVPIDSFIRMNNTMKEKFTEYKLEPVMERVKNKLKYFNIEVKLLYESELKNDLIISDLADTTNSIIRIKDASDLSSDHSSDFSSDPSQKQKEKQDQNQNQKQVSEELVGIIASWDKNE